MVATNNSNGINATIEYTVVTTISNADNVYSEIDGMLSLLSRVSYYENDEDKIIKYRRRMASLEMNRNFAPIKNNNIFQGRWMSRRIS